MTDYRRNFPSIPANDVMCADCGVVYNAPDTHICATAPETAESIPNSPPR